MQTEKIKGPEYSLTAEDFKKMIISASHFFDREKELINSLNVFPVPDGDTGTNMSMTLSASAEACVSYSGNSVGELSSLVATSALMGARGNSGVILSQLLRGIARGLQKKDTARPQELSKAFEYSVVYAYKAVSKPVEGTILTVAREMARGARQASREGADLDGVLEQAISSGQDTLERTTEMLPVLKEAGVVDAGGKGLIVFLEGCRYSLQHSLTEILSRLEQAKGEALRQPAPVLPGKEDAEPLDLDNPYCTELIVKSDGDDTSALKKLLEGQGDSLLVVSHQEVTKVHIHTANPGKVLSTCLEYGTLHDLKIENMIDQHTRTSTPPAMLESMVTLKAPPKVRETGETGIIAVSFGEGIKDLFLSLGADEIVYGGQTMNPKVEDLLEAVNRISTDRVIILPNNKNIQLVAQQVRDLSDKEVAVLPSNTIPQGIIAMLAFNSSAGIEDNMAAMEELLEQVKTGEVTFATRDTKIHGQKVKKGDYLGLSNGRISAAGEDLTRATLDLIGQMIDKEDEIITILQGKSVSDVEAKKMAAVVQETYPDLEVELKWGGQPIYYYIISVE